MKTNKSWSIIMMLVVALGTTVSFSSCDDDDDKVLQETTVDMSKIIGNWSVDSDDFMELFYFANDKKVVYEYDNYDDDNSEGVIAEGHYTVEENVITAKYEDVWVDSYRNKEVMGFTNKTSKTVRYTIKKIETTGEGTKMTLVNGINGKTLEVYKY